MSVPTIAIVGRPNVGKSTLFNRFLKRRKAIVDATARITRDRVYGTMDWVGHTFQVVDTGGYIPGDLDVIDTAVREQARMAIEEADIILFMVDGRTEITASDRILAQLIRESEKPHILVVNKCDSLGKEEQIYAFHELSLDPVIGISALSGRRTGDLLDTVLKQLNLSTPVPVDEMGDALHLAIVGMPNVGKSSLTNALLQKEQSIVTPVAGTTRDSIDTPLRWHGQTMVLVDTAGLRKKARVKDSIEFYSSVRAQRAIEACHVALVLIDAVKGFGKQDKSIVEQVIRKGKGLVLIVNKWDLIKKETHTQKEFEDEIRDQFKSMDHYPILFLSARTTQRIHRVLETAAVVHQNRKKELATSALNRFLEKALAAYQPPAIRGKVIRIKYGTQVHSEPPVFAIFTNYPNLVTVPYKRYLENRLREQFDFQGVPLKLSFRKK